MNNEADIFNMKIDEDRDDNNKFHIFYYDRHTQSNRHEVIECRDEMLLRIADITDDINNVDQVIYGKAVKRSFYEYYVENRDEESERFLNNE